MLTPQRAGGTNANGPQKRAVGDPDGCPMRSDYAENDEPQPQVEVAFGFLITNWAPSRSSL